MKHPRSINVNRDSGPGSAIAGCFHRLVTRPFSCVACHLSSRSFGLLPLSLRKLIFLQGDRVVGLLCSWLLLCKIYAHADTTETIVMENQRFDPVFANCPETERHGGRILSLNVVRRFAQNHVITTNCSSESLAFPLVCCDFSDGFNTPADCSYLNLLCRFHGFNLPNRLGSSRSIFANMRKSLITKQIEIRGLRPCNSSST